MNAFSFKNLKFLKSKSTPIKKPKKGNSTAKKEKKLSFCQKLIRNPFLYLVVFAALLSYFISYVPSKSLPLIPAGEIASTDVMAPTDLTIKDKETTKERKKEAEEAVSPVYDFNQNVFLNTEEKIREFFVSGRELIKKKLTEEKINKFKQKTSENYGINIPEQTLKNLIHHQFDSRIEENLINLIGKISEKGIILSKNLFIHGERKKGLTLLQGSEEENTVQVAEILDIKESKTRLTEEIESLDLRSNEKSMLETLSHLFISPNITYNKVQTEARKKQARESVEPVFYTIKKGKIIVRKGDEVTPEEFKQIQMINQNLSLKPSWIKNFVGTFLLFGLLFLTLWYYLKSVLKSSSSLKTYQMMGITLILSLFFYKLSNFLADLLSQYTHSPIFNSIEIYRYAFPLQFGVLLFAFLTGNEIALIYAVINGLLVGYLFKANFFLMIFSLVGGFAAIYGIKYFGRQNRNNTFKAGIFLVAPINAFLIIIFLLVREEMGSLSLFLAGEMVMGLLGGILSAVLAFLFLPIFEQAFSMLTQSKLLELTNSDLPIFRQMAMEAPGSYHHSLAVASLSEKAAEELHLNPILLRAGAMYHDIGKIKRPEYFIENRTRNPDRHKELKPSMSKLVIVNHVKEGLERAKKLKLPRKIRDIIAQHHGSSLIRYFYNKAKEKYGTEVEKQGDETYRYPGPLPQSKEAALIMLADSVEAASRSLKNPSKTNLQRLINEIFNSYLQDGQLDNSGFSFKEIKTIASSFFSSLFLIYHPRTKYPGFDFENHKEKNTPENKSNDRNHKQTK
ncbi:HDIG domain-containing protein [bacterium]|nr:HDIG domain-containing protein [bacterium]